MKRVMERVAMKVMERAAIKVMERVAMSMNGNMSTRNTRKMIKSGIDEE